MKPPWQMPEGWPRLPRHTAEDRAGGRKAYAAIKDDGTAPAASIAMLTGHTLTETLTHLRYLESVHVVRTVTEAGVMRWQQIPENRWEIHAPF